MSQEINVQRGQKLDKKTLLFWAITIAVPILILLIPESATYTHAIKWFFAITICMILIVDFNPITFAASYLWSGGASANGRYLWAMVQFDAVVIYCWNDYRQYF